VDLNGNFGHLGTMRTALSRVGWFDEKFLDFKSKDSNFYWGIEQSYPDLQIRWNSSPGIHNISSQVSFDEIKSNDSNNYPVFNRAFLPVKYKLDKDESRSNRIPPHVLFVPLFLEIKVDKIPVMQLTD
jgi:hypothetical protein